MADNIDLPACRFHLADQPVSIGILGGAEPVRTRAAEAGQGGREIVLLLQAERRDQRLPQVRRIGHAMYEQFHCHFPTSCLTIGEYSYLAAGATFGKIIP